jgi:hypothetical protein
MQESRASRLACERHRWGTSSVKEKTEVRDMDEIRMQGLEEAKERLREAQEEFERYTAAQRRAASDESRWNQEARNLRRTVAQTAEDYYMGEGEHSVDEIAELNERIHRLDGLIGVARVAADKLALEIRPRGESRFGDLERLRSNVAILKSLIPEYERGKRLYPEMYERVKRDRGDSPLRSSHSDSDIAQFRRLRGQILHVAEQLGCVDDCEKFLATVEGESEE